MNSIMAIEKRHKTPWYRKYSLYTQCDRGVPGSGELSHRYRIQLFNPCPWCGHSTSVDARTNRLYCENIYMCGALWDLLGDPIPRNAQQFRPI